MWHWLGQMPAYQARRWVIVYFNVAVWAIVGGAIGLAVWIG
jgi:hypothetical protein